MGKLLDRYIHRKALTRWQRDARAAPEAVLSELRQQRDDARRLRSELDALILQANSRLTRPVAGSTHFPKPLGTDWSWRPELWRYPQPRPGVASAPRKARINDEATLFHDCPRQEISTRQIRNTRKHDLSPFSLAVEVFGFEGSFLSLSIELPQEAVQGLTRQHLIRVDCHIEAERPQELFARLNIRHGPNAEQVLRKLDPTGPSNSVDFDLAHLPLNERRMDKVWLDIILDNPRMNRIVLQDLTVCRHHRADL